MLKQQQAEGELLGIYGKLIATSIIIVLLGVFGYRYFDNIDQITGQTEQRAKQRMQNMLVSIKSQWLATGQPEYLLLDWQVASDFELAEQPVKISIQGWPLPATNDDAGCLRLWRQLMGSMFSDIHKAAYQADIKVCDYMLDNSVHLSYQLDSGRLSDGDQP